jgi:hypothetical protein
VKYERIGTFQTPLRRIACHDEEGLHFEALVVGAQAVVNLWSEILCLCFLIFCPLMFQKAIRSLAPFALSLISRVMNEVAPKSAP